MTRQKIKRPDHSTGGSIHLAEKAAAAAGQIGQIIVLGCLGVFGLLLVGICGLVVAAVTANQWAAEWKFPRAGTPEGDIARIAWAEPISDDWSDPPRDISSKVCPLIGGGFKAKVQPTGGWTMALGSCPWTQERVVTISIDPETGTCRATVGQPLPRCAL